MRILLTLVVVAGLALVAQPSTATDPETNAAAPAIDAHYDMMGSAGILTVVAPDGTNFIALDSDGAEVAAGVVSDGAVELMTPNAGADETGVVILIHAEGGVLAVSDDGYSDWWF